MAPPQYPVKKLLILVDWFAPGYKGGGPIRSSYNLATALQSNYNIMVVTTDTDHGEALPYAHIQSNKWLTDLYPGLRVYYANKKALNMKQLKLLITSSNADFVYLNHVWSPFFVLYPLWLKFTGKIKGKIILCPRGGLYPSALVVKRFKKTPVLLLMKWLKMKKWVTFHATNYREKDAIENYFPNSKIVIADNLPTTYQSPLKKFTKQKGSLKGIFISRIVPIKNLLFLLEVLQAVKSSVQLTIVGPIEHSDYWKQCEDRINAMPANIVVEYLGSKKNEELEELIQNNHLYILPTTGENFGHSIFESLLAGRPVLISDQTPWLNLIEKKIGWDIPLNSPQRFVEAIESASNWDQHEFDLVANSSWQFAKDFNTNSSEKEKYLELFS